MTDGDDDRAGLEQLFDGAVIPEATPSPRTIRFATRPIHGGPSRVYASSAAATDDPRVARLFREFDAVSQVLVGPDFVAVTISHPDRWEVLLGPMLGAVTEEFAGAEPVAAAEPQRPAVQTLRVGSDDDPDRARRRVDRAWAELGTLRADRPDHLERILDAAHDPEAARRQVAATLLTDAPATTAAREWRRLVDDPSRTVRRSVVDAISGTGREDFRPVLVHALDDPDAWTRWKALHGIAALGVGPSRAVVEARTEDPDFRVRLEAARVLARDHG
jgi:hypothetical protein